MVNIKKVCDNCGEELTLEEIDTGETWCENCNLPEKQHPFIINSNDERDVKFWNAKRIIEDNINLLGNEEGKDELRNLVGAKSVTRFLKETNDKLNEKEVKPSIEIFEETKTIFSKYLDTSELNLNLFTIWTIGTYFHSQFETYPILIVTARKQSGKTRVLKLTSSLSHGSDGSVSTSVTDTFLFRHKNGAIFFDEMESLSSKEKTSMRELINSVYKKGNKIVRYKEKNKEYVEDSFFPFYPLGLANIYGFGDVLSDRSIQIILQRSNKNQTKLIEDFNTNPEILSLKNKLLKLNAEIPKGIFSEWNNYIQNKGCNESLKEVFEAVSKTNLSGRPLELFFPLFIVANIFGILSTIIKCSEEYLAQLEGEYVDNMDDSLQDFMDKQTYFGYINLSIILESFKKSIESPEEWINSKWLGRALKRLGLVENKRRINGRIQVILKNKSINSTNTTNNTNPINSTNYTNSTSNKVDLVDFVDKVEEKRCIICDSLGSNLTQDNEVFYCGDCGGRGFEKK